MIATFIFYNYSNSLCRIWSLNTPYKHVDVLIKDDDNVLKVILFRGKNIKIKKLSNVNYFRFIQKLKALKSINALVTVNVKEKVTSRAMTVSSCNELARILTGIDIGFTLNPGSLYKKLLKYDYLRNYGVINAWKRE